MAKKFKFSLYAVLRIRKIEEKYALSNLSKVLSVYNKYEGEKLENKKELQSSILAFEKESKEKKIFSIRDKLAYEAYWSALYTKVKLSQKKIDQLKTEVEEEQNKVKEARGKSKVMELLKEKEKKEYDHSLQKKEKKELSALNNLQYNFLLGKREKRN